MQTTIELPESVYRRSEQVARKRGMSVSELAALGLEREIADEPELEPERRYVTLPLIVSTQPGTLNLSNFDFDDLLA